MATPERTTGALSRTEYLVIEFDRHTAKMTVLDDLGYSAYNRDDAHHDAKLAARKAAEHGLDREYVVTRVGADARYASRDVS